MTLIVILTLTECIGIHQKIFKNMTKYFHTKNREMLLEKAEILINDDVPTDALIGGISDETFYKSFKELTNE